MRVFSRAGAKTACIAVAVAFTTAIAGAALTLTAAASRRPLRKPLEPP